MHLYYHAKKTIANKDVLIPLQQKVDDIFEDFFFFIFFFFVLSGAQRCKQQLHRCLAN